MGAKTSAGSSSGSSRVSTSHLQGILDRLLRHQNRSSTCKTYLRIWRNFNKFVISLDVKPKSWEDRVILFVSHLIDKGLQSSSVKSYVSAIKRVLIDDGCPWQDQKAILSALTKSCRMINDRVMTRLPITCGLLELILFEVQRRYRVVSNQPYLEIMYKALLALGYYGMMRIGELTLSEHVVKVRNVHLAENKQKIMVVLYFSKTHSKANRPQKIKIMANNIERAGNYKHRYFCPFKLVKDFLILRHSFNEDIEPLFVYSDGRPVTPDQARAVLADPINKLGLDSTLYGMHSLCIGRTSDLAKFHYEIDEIRRLGRWKSNVVYKYIRQ